MRLNRLVALGLTVAVTLSSVVPSYALYSDVDISSPVVEAYVTTLTDSMKRLVLDVAESGKIVLDKMNEATFGATLSLIAGPFCPSSYNRFHSGAYEVVNDGSGVMFSGVCHECGKVFEILDVDIKNADLENAFDEFLSNAPPGLTASDSGVSAKGQGFTMVTTGWDSDFWCDVNLFQKASAATVGQFMLLGAAGSVSSFYGLTVGRSPAGARYIVLAEVGSLTPYSAVDFPMGEFVSLSSEIIINDYYYDYMIRRVKCYLSQADFLLDTRAGILDDACQIMTPKTCISDISSRYTSTGMGNGTVSLSDVYFVSEAGGAVGDLGDYTFGYVPGTSRYAYSANPREFDVSDQYSYPSRTSSLMAILNEYNEKHTLYNDPNYINYCISPVGSDGLYFQPGLFDEEKLVYTDPVTGTEYLTNGWAYDYKGRCYTLHMADDNFMIGDTVISSICLTYGDDVLTVEHYDADGILVQIDTYNYVAVSGSTCSLNGHTYNITGTQDPTCIAAGSRTFTCSVCGNQYVEAIPMNDHAYGEFAVVQDPTCTAPGIHSFTCSTCGGQYTDTIPALGHDWQPTASTEEAYVMPDNVSCPDCHGTDFSWDRQDLELKYGKNLFDISQYKVQEESTTNAWISEVGSNYIVVSEPEGYSSVGAVSSLLPLSVFAPGLKAGQTYVLSLDSDYARKRIYLNGSKRLWNSETALEITQADLDGSFVVYGFDASKHEPGPCRVWNIQIEPGTVATEYAPYDPEYVEIIPPLYTFTCSDPDCSTVWTEEAEYQGATVTYTCTTCGATRTEAAGEEAGLFHSIGNLIADGITWVTDKLAELIDSLTVMMANFNSYLDSVKNSGGQFPAFLASIFALFPQDFMNVIWFSLVAVVVLLVWKKWFS